MDDKDEIKLLPKYDYIIAGAGMAGLMLALELAKSPLKNKTVLLVDKEEKNSNDRTWCYWSNSSPEMDSLVYKKWDSIRFATANSDASYLLAPYHYKYIRGADFYTYTDKILKSNTNFTRYNGIITELSSNGFIIVNNIKVEADLIFNSIHPSFANFRYPKNECYYLLQHFKGYFIKTEEDVFDTESATFMDFNIPQIKEARFGYILPFSKREALVEYTLFSQNLLTKEEYILELENYITNKLGIQKYEILHEEFGIVPMSTYSYAPKIDGKLIKIGTFGGSVKPSTGFAFTRTNKRIKSIVKDLVKYGRVKSSTLETSFKYKLYDNILLSILEKDNTSTKDVFEKMFTKMKTTTILKFLDEESNLWQDIQIMSLFMTDFRFTKAIAREVKRMIWK